MVAAGEADLVATLRWGYEWDVAAAALIAREAGAAVSDAFGQTLAYNKRDPRAFGLLVSAPAIHAAAIERLAERAGKLPCGLDRLVHGERRDALGHGDAELRQQFLGLVFVNVHVWGIR